MSYLDEIVNKLRILQILDHFPHLRFVVNRYTSEDRDERRHLIVRIDKNTSLWNRMFGKSIHETTYNKMLREKVGESIPDFDLIPYTEVVKCGQHDVRTLQANALKLFFNTNPTNRKIAFVHLKRSANLIIPYHIFNSDTDIDPPPYPADTTQYIDETRKDFWKTFVSIVPNTKEEFLWKTEHIDECIKKTMRYSKLSQKRKNIGNTYEESWSAEDEHEYRTLQREIFILKLRIVKNWNSFVCPDFQMRKNLLIVNNLSTEKTLRLPDEEV